MSKFRPMVAWQPACLVRKTSFLGLCFLCIAPLSVCFGLHFAPSAELLTCKIYLLTVSDWLADTLPSCAADNLTLCYLQNLYGKTDRRLHDKHSEPHYLSQYSQVKWLLDGLKMAGVLVDDIHQADAVFVDDYCYSAYWIGSMHSEGHGEYAGAFNPYSTIAEMYHAIANLPEYQATDGRTFAITYPHVWHPDYFSDTMCGRLKGALHITLEATHCYVCPPESRPKQLVIPFPSPSWADVRAQALVTSRPQLLFFLGTCLSVGEDQINTVNGSPGAGKVMRHRLVHHLLGLQPADVQSTLSCVKRLPHAEVREQIMSSTFCLLPPGDTVSSRRLTDIILGGCIPVFVGPPYHNTPFSDHIKYSEIGLFLDVLEFHNLSSSEHLGRPHPLPPGQAKDMVDVDWWIPTTDFSEATVSLSMDDMWAYLQAVPEDVIAAKMRKIRDAQPLFDYASLAKPLQEDHGKLDRGPSIVHVVVDAMCRHSGAAQSSH